MEIRLRNLSWRSRGGDEFAALRELEDSELLQWAVDFVERKSDPLTEAERAQVDGTPEIRHETHREAWIDTMTEPSGDFFNALRGKGLYILVLEDPKKTLIIGDDPITPMITPDATLNHPDATNLVPVALDVAVACSGISTDEELGLIPKSGKGACLICEINRAILKQSSMVASPSERLTELLSRYDQH